MDNNYNLETLTVQAGYSGDNGVNAVVPPIYATNAYTFNSAEHAKRLFSLEESGNIYSRLTNPTCAFFEDRINALEGGVGALSFSSGHAAMFNAVINLCDAGDEVVSSINIYGGAINMFGISLGRIGIKVTFVDPSDLSAWENAITDKTKLLFTEVVGNPNVNLADIGKIAEIAHKHGIVFMADGTFTTPFLNRPLDFGADLVIHSASKYLIGSGAAMAGVIVDGGRFNFKGNPRYPHFNEADPSYHGIVFADLGKTAFITRLRALVMRDLGACLSPYNAFIALVGMDTLALRMKKHSENAQKVAEFLETLPKVSRVNYPTLPSSRYFELSKKYLSNGGGGVLTFELAGGRAAGAKFLDSIRLLKNATTVGEVRSNASHPASTTHSQLTAEQLIASGISEGNVRLAIGIEDAEDIIADIKQAIEKI